MFFIIFLITQISIFTEHPELLDDGARRPQLEGRSLHAHTGSISPLLIKCQYHQYQCKLCHRHCTRCHFSAKKLKTFTFQLMNDHPASLVPAFDSKVTTRRIMAMVMKSEAIEGSYRRAAGKDKRKFFLVASFSLSCHLFHSTFIWRFNNKSSTPCHMATPGVANNQILQLPGGFGVASID